MNLNNIELPASVIADLYKHSLVDISVISTAVSPITMSATDASANSWKSLGANRKNILIIVTYPDVVHLPDDALTLLTGILGACKLSLADVAVVNLHHHPHADFKDLTLYFKPKIAMLFGVDPGAFGLPLSFPHFQIQPFKSVSYLYSPVLAELGNDKALKTKLWASLRRLFNI